MLNKHKHYTAVATALMMINIGIADTAYADEPVGHKWTKAEVLNFIILTACMNEIDLEKERKSFENDFDNVSQHLVEILNESDDPLAIRSALNYIEDRKTHHELVVKVISNKLESWISSHQRDSIYIKIDAAKVLGNFGGDTATTILIGMLDDEDKGVKWFAISGLRKIGTDRAYNALSEFVSRQRDESEAKRDRDALDRARDALRRMNQTRENTNKNAPNPTQKEPAPKITDAPQPEPPTPANTNETTQASQDTPPAQPEKTSSNKSIFWLAVIALLAAIGGVVVWRNKKCSR